MPKIDIWGNLSFIGGLTIFLVGITYALLSSISPSTLATLTGAIWFPKMLAGAFMPSLALSLYIGAGISFIAALLCAMCGDKYVEEIDGASRTDSPSTDPQEVSGENGK